MYLRAPTSRTFGLWLMAFLAGTAASTSWADEVFQPPVVELTQVDLSKADLLKQDLVLHFRISNPNESKLSVYGLAYKVRLGDIELVSDGESRQSFTVSARSHQEFEVPVTTNLWRRLKPLVKLLKKAEDSIPYRVSGEIKTGRLFGRKVPFFHSGELTNGEMLASNP
ncbi:LEA14-like dessication related protein [Azotobacter beijerinckii]|uniref:LEA14-like dessication related protein n=2 Tax=Azotobacter beijerinckii TaxID=170623 RepID=A0A1H7APH3_9GAMM|nr:LEA14-like dessication related protein [Azotobacter beijerinckii]